MLYKLLLKRSDWRNSCNCVTFFLWYMSLWPLPRLAEWEICPCVVHPTLSNPSCLNWLIPYHFTLPHKFQGRWWQENRGWMQENSLTSQLHVESSFFRTWNWVSWPRKLLFFMELEGSLPCSQQYIFGHILSLLNPIHSPYSLASWLI